MNKHICLGKTVSPVVKTLMDNVDQLATREVIVTIISACNVLFYYVTMFAMQDVITVGQALAILCLDFTAQVTYNDIFMLSIIM